MTLTFLLGVLATVLSLSSFLQKNATKMKVQIGAGSLFWAFHYVMLGNLGVAAVQAAMASRSAASIYTKTNTQKHVLFWISVVIFSIGAYYTWTGLTSALALTAAINNSAALAYRSNKTMRLQMAGSSLLWMSVGIVSHSWPAIASNIVAFLFGMSTWLRLHKISILENHHIITVETISEDEDVVEGEVQLAR